MRYLEILNELFPAQRIQAVLTLHRGSGRPGVSYYGRVAIWEKDRIVAERRCDELEFHRHRTPEAAVKCARKVAKEMSK